MRHDGQMPKKKHRRGTQRSRPQRGPSHAFERSDRRMERDLHALLAQFVLWRREAVSTDQADEEAAHVEPLLRLKAEQLDSADPTYWTEELIEVLLTEVVPRMVIQPREMVMAQVPAMGQFFAFLDEHQRWHPDGIDVDRARSVLEGLEFSALEAADDPTARSFTGNILVHASTLGVDLSTPELFDAYMQWYNTALTNTERHEISDTGRLANPSMPFEASHWTGSGSDFGGGPDPADVPDKEPGLPWFLPDNSTLEEPLLALERAEDDMEELTAAHGDVRLVQRAARLLEFLGKGRQVTSTGALRLADVRTLVEEWEIDTGPFAVTSMWQVDEIAGPWSALIAGGWVTLTSTRAYPEQHDHAPYVPASEDPEAFTTFARAVMLMLLITLVQNDPDEGGFRGGPDTFAALLFAASPDGLTLPDANSILAELASHDHGEHSARKADFPAGSDQMWQMWRVQADLMHLSRCGLLRHDPMVGTEQEEVPDPKGSTFRGNLAVFAVVITAVDATRQGGV